MTPTSELLPSIRWWPVIGGALLLELHPVVVSVPVVAMGGEGDLLTIMPPVTLIVAFFVGLWVGKRAARPVLNAALAGAISIPVYCAIAVMIILTQRGFVESDPLLFRAYLAIQFCKVLGAAAGGWWIAGKRAQNAGS